MSCQRTIGDAASRRVTVAACLASLILAVSPAPAESQRIALEARLSNRTWDLSRAALPTDTVGGGAALTRALAWRAVRPGVQLSELELRAGSLGLPVQAVLLRVDPHRVSFSLQLRTASNGMTGAWRVDSMPADAVFGMNAGQFKETGPWGWLLLDGETRRDAARAPLAASVGIDSAGRLRWIPSGSEGVARGLRFGFQSFPRLLEHGRVPPILRDTHLVDAGHRDARLMLAELGDGSVLFVLTRFTGLGAAAERVPIGLTTPESLALVLALGAREAVMLDGGISGQLLVRDSAGLTTGWRGMRSVPLGLVAHSAGAH